GGLGGRAFSKLRRTRFGVGGVEREGDVGPGAPRLVDQFLQQIVGALGPLAMEDRLERIEPLLGFQSVGIVRGGKFGQRRHDVSCLGVAARWRGTALSLPRPPPRISPWSAHYNS